MKCREICGISRKLYIHHSIKSYTPHVSFSIKDIHVINDISIFKWFDVDTNCFSGVPMYVNSRIIPHLKFFTLMQKRKRYNLEYLKIPIEGLTEIVRDE